ncbi:hypothetical protein AA12717_3563 [Gluconacetobacter sacchari DSM 12717]|uniref:Alcohol dehydrogenase n=2 Tax=Gluconacetobacter sacchari TaxID=92759 RepID=A0A7W4IEN3_9PROT|nr:alcohol dehydrogenase [Gluconacetobacter sacchari]MBB2161466.1 alcohol dehydrogenase [Gluconacetobacter sacchari]GBQ30740.1 hypothetical protein AA12717_3563 [Gluconacetobacter sacchari DSM 12717]
MIRFSLRACAVLVAVTGFAMHSLPALAGPTEDHPPIVNDFAPATVSGVGGISLANLAGVLNYCVDVNLVSHQDGDAVQTAINAKTGATPPDQRGNVDYAVGTAGQFIVGGTTSTLTRLEAADQGKICSAVLTRAKSSI